MSAQEFVIDGELMALNEYTNACRGHWSNGNEAKREQTDRVAWFVRKARLRPYDGPVEVGICWIEGKRRRKQLRDIDNIMFSAKFILDALKECGVIVDDSPRYVRRIYPSFMFNSDNPRVEVVITEYSERRTVHYMPVTGIE